jgi:hypothetical protein
VGSRPRRWPTRSGPGVGAPRRGLGQVLDRDAGASSLFRFPLPRGVHQPATKLGHGIGPLRAPRLLARARLNLVHRWVRATKGRLGLTAGRGGAIRRLGDLRRWWRLWWLLAFPRGTEPARDHQKHDQQPQEIREALHRSGARLARVPAAVRRGSSANQCPSSGLAMALRISVSLSMLRNLT